MKACIVATDGMACQRAIAQKSIDQDADSVLALKGNQAAMHQAVEESFDSTAQDTANPTELLRQETVGGNHGRIETRHFCFNDTIQ